MGYTFTFGRKVHLDPPFNPYNEDDGREYIERAPDDPDVHWDIYESPACCGSAGRSPSYLTWDEMTRYLPKFGALWRDMQTKYGPQYGEATIPVSEFLDRIPEVQAEALSSRKAIYAQRVLWFCRWAQRVHGLYGEDGVFDRPGEWY